MLIEPPGMKRGVPTVNNRLAQNLINVAPADDDDDIEGDDLDGPSAHDPSSKRTIAQKLDGFLVFKSNSYEYSERWKREFSERPSWCDADMALQQIKRGKARGNRAALYSRSLIQKALFSLGSFVQRHAFVVIFTVLTLFGICCYGLQFVRIETDIVKLWVAKGGRLDEELSFYLRVQEQSSANGTILRENGLGGGYQVVIQTPRREGQNILSKEGLLEHVTIMQQIARYKVEVAGENWTLSDICFKPPTPSVSSSPFGSQFVPVIDRIMPCIWITPIDCFWEGSKALGPHPAIDAKDLGLARELFKSLRTGDHLSWSNIDPQAVIDDINEIFTLSTLHSFFHRAEIGKGYLDRYCIDPLDPECPVESPNHFAFCELIPRFLEYAERNGFEVPVDPEYRKKENASKNEVDSFDSWFGFFGGSFSRKRRNAVHQNSELGTEKINAEVATPIAHAHLERDKDSSANRQDAYTNSIEKPVDSVSAEDAVTVAQTDVEETLISEPNVLVSTSTTTSTTTESSEKTARLARELAATNCAKYARPFSDWLKNNRDKWHELLSKEEYPKAPNFGKVMTGGCRGFAKGVMSWPQDLIIGGVKEYNRSLHSAEALQSVFLVASPNDVFLRFKDGAKSYSKPKLNSTEWDITVAEKVIKTWQRNFTDNLYNHEWNFDVNKQTGVVTEHRRIHPLASTSIADMLEEFCKFNYTIIFVGYFLMLVYALQAQMKRHGCMLAVDSCMGLAFAGVFLVTFASIAGLGLATWFGIEFNAATTQIVPFLTLGIGVDNMFLLLHNYHGVVENVKKDEIGLLMKETGMSVVMTSINNILSFLAGTVLPIPALRSFCAQSSILLSFNLIAILTVYPAIISIDLRRRKSSRRDICCWSTPENSLPSEDNDPYEKPHIQEKRSVGEIVPAYHSLYSRSDREDDVEDDVKPWTLHAFLRHYYIPLLKKSSTKVMVLVICACMFVAGILGMQRATYGLELSDVLPEHTAPAAFLKARDRYFSFYPMFAVLKGPNIDYAVDQHKIDTYRLSIARSRFVVKVNGGEPSEEYWLGLMRVWLLRLQSTLDAAIASGKIDPATGRVVGEKEGFNGRSLKLTPDENIAYHLTCSYGSNYNCSERVGKIKLVDESGTINVAGFYNYITGWYNTDSMMYHVSQASFYPAPPEWDDKKSNFVPPAAPFTYSQIPFYLTGLTDTPVIVEMIKEIRAICDMYAEEGLPNFPSGIAFTFWEQYLHLSSNLLQAICVIALAVLCVISIIIFNPWAASIIMIILVLMTVELTGFLGLSGIKLNPVSAVTIITAVGIGVEFTAHVVLAFLTSLGTRNERMAMCVDRVFVPVIHGALSTLLGIIMLAFSEFEFVVKYFFVVMSALIVIGVINGLLLLPVLLSLIGPPCEITPIDGGDRLPPPPALRKKKSKKRTTQEMQTHRRNDSDDSNTGTLGPENCSTMLLMPPRDGGSGPGPRLVANAHARSASAHIQHVAV